MSHQFDYAFAPGWNVALNALSNIEETLGSRNRSADGVLFPISIAGELVDPYPIATLLESGRVRGDGKVPTAWTMYMFDTASSYLMSLFTAKSVPWTIYTRRHELGTYARYNAWAVRPGGDDLVYVQDRLLRVVVRYSDLQAL